MANVYLDAPSGNANLRMVFSSGDNYLRADNGSLEAFDDIADYRVSPTDSVALSAGLARYRFVVPTPAVLPVSLDLVASDIVANEILGSGSIRLDADGNEVDDAASLASVLADTAELQTLLGGTPIDGRLDQILGKLNASIVRVTSAVLDEGSLELVAGDDYRAADGRALSWTVRDWSGPALGTLTVELRLMLATEYAADGAIALSVAGAVVGAGDDAVFSAELTAAQTAALETIVPGTTRYNYVYQLLATDGDSHVQTIALAAATVKRKVPSG